MLIRKLLENKQSLDAPSSSPVLAYMYGCGSVTMSTYIVIGLCGGNNQVSQNLGSGEMRPHRLRHVNGYNNILLNRCRCHVPGSARVELGTRQTCQTHIYVSPINANHCQYISHGYVGCCMNFCQAFINYKHGTFYRSLTLKHIFLKIRCNFRYIILFSKT